MKPLIVVAILFLASLAIAQDKAPSKSVRVVGTADVKVAPDRAVLELGVEKQNASIILAKQAADSAARKILAGLRTNGIDEKDIQTTLLSLHHQTEYRNKVKVSYFTAQQTLSVTVRDLSKLDVLLEYLIKAGVNRIDSIEYETSDLRKYRDQARDLAVKAAREKAEALAKALGQSIGKANAIEETPASQYTANASGSFYFAGRSTGASTAAGQITVSASVTVSFDLN
jgi:uncharacterized protein YggE